jgi:hypothetical protein
MSFIVHMQPIISYTKIQYEVFYIANGTRKWELGFVYGLQNKCGSYLGRLYTQHP